LNLWLCPSTKILDAVQDQLVDAGLLIHEGQLMYGKMGLHRVLDLGVWWQEQTGLPIHDFENSYSRLRARFSARNSTMSGPGSDAGIGRA